MLNSTDLENVQELIVSNASRIILREEVEKIRQGLNPHPAQQKELNVPRLGEEEVPGMQHKYRETVLFFPAEGQVNVDEYTNCVNGVHIDYENICSDLTSTMNTSRVACAIKFFRNFLSTESREN